MQRQRIGRRLLAPFMHAVVAHHPGHPQPVAGENARAAGGLAAAVHRVGAPAGDRRVILPEGQAEQLAWIAEAPETLDRDEAGDLLQEGLQPGGVVQVFVEPALGAPPRRSRRSWGPPVAASHAPAALSFARRSGAAASDGRQGQAPGHDAAAGGDGPPAPPRVRFPARPCPTGPSCWARCGATWSATAPVTFHAMEDRRCRPSCPS